MGKPKTDSGEQKNPPTRGSDQSAKSDSSGKPNPAKLPPAGFIYSDDEDLMDELSMGWGLTAAEEQDELDQIINKTVDMSKVSNTKLKALAEPPKDGMERIERVRAERASRELPQQSEDVTPKQSDERETALRRAKQAAAEKDEAARAAAQKEKAEREYAEKQAAEREAALKARAQEQAKQKAEKEARDKQEKEDKARQERDSKERAEREARERAAREQEEEEARERAALEARLLKRAEEEARLRDEKERKEEAERQAVAKAKAEKDAAEREEAEREIAERQRLQKEAAAKLKARQEEARREAEEAERREREEQERAEQEEKARVEQGEKERAEQVEKERAEKEEKERAEKEEKERAEKEEKARSEKTTAAAPVAKVTKFESGKKEIKAQRIGGPKTGEEKIPAATKADSENKTESKPETKPPTPATPTTAKLSRTPEEELAALLAEDGNEPDPPVEMPKKIIAQDAKTSRSGLAAMEPTDDTPLTGMLKVIKPAESAKSPARVSDDKESAKVSGPAAGSAETEKEVVAVAALASDDAAAELEKEESPLEEAAEVKEDTVEPAHVDESLVANALQSSEVSDVPVSEAADELSKELESAPEPVADVPDFLKTDVPPKPDEKPEKTGLAGVDKFYKPERVKLSDFVKKKSGVAEEKPAEKEPVKAAEAKAEEAKVEEVKAEVVEKPEKAEAQKEQAETAALKILNLPEPAAAKSEASGEFGKPSKDEIRDSVKQESPEKKAAIIAALKKLEEQVDESDLDSLSTDSLKDVLAKLPEMSGKNTVTGAPAVPGKKEGTRTRMPSPAVARLASAEEPSADRDIAREKLKVMQKMAHTLPDVKSYLPQKRALLLIVAAVILGLLAAVMTVRAETISARQSLEKKDYNGALNSLGIALALYPFSAEGHFLKGSALYLTNKLNEAYTEYDTALKLSPGMRDALERRAAVSYRLGNYSQSVADYEKLLQQEGEQSQRFDQLLSLANAYLSAGDLQKAADMYNRCLDRKPNYLAAMVGKIAVSNEKKLYERAVIEAGKALAVSPANRDILVLRARAYTGIHNFALAQKDIDVALKKNPKSGAVYAARANLRLAEKKNADAHADFDKALKLSPKEATIYLERARAYVNEQKYDLAAKDIAKARQIMGSQLTADLYVVNAPVQIAGKQAAKALEDLKEAQQKFPNNPDIVLAMADALAATGKIGDGIVATEKAMELDRTYVSSILKHGLLSVKFGNKMRAAADFEDVLKLDPKNVTALKTRGLMYLQQEKYASAQEDLAKVVALDPSQSDAKAGLDKARTLFARITRVRSTGVQREGPSDAYLASLAGKSFDTLINDGYAAYKKGDYQTAVPTLEQAVKVNPRDARARRYMAYAYKQADQMGEAASQFDILYASGALGPQDTQTFIEMLLGSGQQDRAHKIIEDAIAKAPGNQNLYLQLANCQVAQGETQKAIQTCTKGIAIGPRTAIGQQLFDLRQSLLGGGSGSGNPGGGTPTDSGA